MGCRGKCLVFLLVLFNVLGSGSGYAETHRPMLPEVYTEQDVTGWWMSEKLDGIRGYWDGHRLYSKNGHPLNPPPEFTATFPPFPLEGELWAGRSSFEETSSIVQRKEAHPGWMRLGFGIFDLPEEAGSFRQRISKISEWFQKHPSPTAFVIEQIPVADREHLRAELKRIEQLGGEGLIVRDPDARYEAGRSMQILKVKNFDDAEAIVVAHLPGKGKYEGRLGALLVEQTDGLCFRIGTGFSDIERDNPPAIGTLITYKFYGRYLSGLPKFPSYLRVRRDSEL
jgi:DNA ligase-1